MGWAAQATAAMEEGIQQFGEFGVPLMTQGATLFLVPELTQPVTLDLVQEEAQQSVGSGVPVPARCAQTPGHVRRPRRPKESAADRRQRRLRGEARL